MSRETIAPFPYPGGKNSAAEIVWSAFEGINSYIEPFCGSAAVFLVRPRKLRFETLNDACGFVPNFWRSCVAAPEIVAEWCERIRSEVELVACGRWLNSLNLAERLKADPSFCDPVAAGCWAWYLSTSIGVKVSENDKQQPRLIRQGTMGDRKRERLPEIIYDIRSRLLDARILCGDWKACLGPSNHQDSWHTDPIGVFFDPPYRGFELYSEGAVGISAEVRAWCLAHGEDPPYRLALCGYAGEHDGMPGWRAVSWQTRGRVSRKHQEVIWLSPTCAA